MVSKDGSGSGVGETSEDVRCMQETWELIDDLMGGTGAMRKAEARRLPKWPGEHCALYDARLCSATLFPAYSRTVSVLTGKPFSKPVTIGDDVPPRIKEWLDNADLEGRNLDAFAAAVCADALAYGISGILVDAPTSGSGVDRPYFVHVKHDSVLGWKAERRGDAMVLTQLRLKETVRIDDGPYRVRRVEQVRVLEPGRWETWRNDMVGGGAWTLYAQGETSIGVIPYVPVYGAYKRFMVGTPPMLDLAHLNVTHWQSNSDQQSLLHFARVPILLATGFADNDITIGPGSIIFSQDAEADIKYVEHSGAAIEAGRTSLADLEDQMRQIGAELLVIKPGNTSVAQTFSDNEPGMCDLQRIIQAMEDGVDLALEYMAQYAELPTGGHVEIYSDFGVAAQSDASSQLLVTMWTEGAISHPTLLNEQKRRGLLSDAVNVQSEITAATTERKDALDAAAERDRKMIYPPDPDHQPPRQDNEAA